VSTHTKPRPHVRLTQHPSQPTFVNPTHLLSASRFCPCHHTPAGPRAAPD